MNPTDLKRFATTGGGGTATKVTSASLVMQGFKIKEPQVNLPQESQPATMVQTVFGFKEALVAFSIPESECNCPGPKKAEARETARVRLRQANNGTEPGEDARGAEPEEGARRVEPGEGAR